jgi:hypothetical protein
VRWLVPAATLLLCGCDISLRGERYITDAQFKQIKADCALSAASRLEKEALPTAIALVGYDQPYIDRPAEYVMAATERLGVNAPVVYRRY